MQPAGNASQKKKGPSSGNYCDTKKFCAWDVFFQLGTYIIYIYIYGTYHNLQFASKEKIANPLFQKEIIIDLRYVIESVLPGSHQNLPTPAFHPLAAGHFPAFCPGNPTVLGGKIVERKPNKL